MIIDFKEIPVANKGGTSQDLFEQFACDFLETIGYDILTRPDRGPDGKKDFFVGEQRKGISGVTFIKWLVSCKHYAHSGKAVSDNDETDIVDRVKKHNCDGFLGIYSTLPSSALGDKFEGLDMIQCSTYDSTRIEKEILLNQEKDRLLASYFPKSYNEYKNSKIAIEKEKAPSNHTLSSLSEKELLHITKTAIIILKIEKIKEKYFKTEDWDKREKVIRKLYRFANHSNTEISSAILNFLHSVSDSTRAGMNSEMSCSLYSLILTFFYSSDNCTRKEYIDNGKKCIYIGFNLVYDSLMYLNNFRIAADGLTILKYIYLEGKNNGLSELVEIVLEQYLEIEHALNRSNRSYIHNAKEFIKIFKDDLETNGILLPELPDNLYTITFNNHKMQSVF